MSFRKLVHFTQVITFVGTELFIVFFYYLLTPVGTAVMAPLCFRITIISLFSFYFWLTFLEIYLSYSLFSLK